jgi:hypothetical protein
MLSTRPISCGDLITRLMQLPSSQGIICGHQPAPSLVLISARSPPIPPLDSSCHLYPWLCSLRLISACRIGLVVHSSTSSTSSTSSQSGSQSSADQSEVSRIQPSAKLPILCLVHVCADSTQSFSLCYGTPIEVSAQQTCHFSRLTLANVS